MILSSMNRLVPFAVLGVVSIFICSIVMIVANSLALYNSLSQDQEFFIAFDCLIVTGIVILLLLLDLRQPSDYFVDEHEAKNLKKKMYMEDE